MDVISALAQKRACLEKRALLAQALRDRFRHFGFLEVDTPSLIPAPAQEEFIETIPAGSGFLRPSPELEMKQLLAAGYKRIFQFGPCWRAGERGRKHSEEFTMLEYYAAGFDYRKLMGLTCEILAEAAIRVNGSLTLNYQGEEIDFSPESAEWLTVSDAFSRYSPVALDDALAQDRFDEIMVVNIEPQLGRGHLTFLADYPASRAALARRSALNPDVAERWELYIAGIELSNAFSELTDEKEQRQRFAEAAAFRYAHGMNNYPEAEAFFTALHAGLPESSGNALGFDRLVMIFADADNIDAVKF